MSSDQGEDQDRDASDAHPRDDFDGTRHVHKHGHGDYDHAARIISSAEWLTLATIGADGSPQASYLPFAPLLDGLGIVVSRLAAHATNLLERPRACALIVSDEPAGDGNYARARISIDVRARPAAPGSETAADIWTALERRHGEIVATLRGLPDFSALVLEPFHARLVLGFAAAYELDSYGSREQIRAAQRGRFA